MSLETAIELGFDNSREVPDEDDETIIRVWIRCSQCEALCINGVACHEIGCPNMTYECHGCSNKVARHQKYCEDCG